MDSLLQDLRYAARMLARTPGWTAMAVLTLALGTGANTAVFGFIGYAFYGLTPLLQPASLVGIFGLEWLVMLAAYAVALAFGEEMLSGSKFALGMFAPSLWLGWILFAIGQMFALAWLGPVIFAVQHIVPPNMRASASAKVASTTACCSVGAAASCSPRAV